MCFSLFKVFFFIQNCTHSLALHIHIGHLSHLAGRSKTWLRGGGELIRAETKRRAAAPRLSSMSLDSQLHLLTRCITLFELTISAEFPVRSLFSFVQVNWANPTLFLISKSAPFASFGLLYINTCRRLLQARHTTPPSSSLPCLSYRSTLHGHSFHRSGNIANRNLTLRPLPSCGPLLLQHTVLSKIRFVSRNNRAEVRTLLTRGTLPCLPSSISKSPQHGGEEAGVANVYFLGRALCLCFLPRPLERRSHVSAPNGHRWMKQHLSIPPHPPVWLR